jgi:hypothetical protein
VGFVEGILCRDALLAVAMPPGLFSPDEEQIHDRRPMAFFTS